VNTRLGFALDFPDLVVDVVAAGVLTVATVSGVGVRGALVWLSGVVDRDGIAVDMTVLTSTVLPGTRAVVDVSGIVGDCGIFATVLFPCRRRRGGVRSSNLSCLATSCNVAGLLAICRPSTIAE